ncbi:MAG: trehalose-phosphatase [Gammaproteobacteria bacterium]
MTSPARLDERKHALFLDFDGTLADIAPRPDAVRLDSAIPPALSRLQQKLDGALALITGRPMDDIDGLLAPLRLPAAYEHGAVRRLASGEVLRAMAPELADLRAVARQLVKQYPALLLEEKSASLALHFRQAPELEAVCRSAFTSLLGERPDLKLLQGKAVMEIKSASVHKGMAIAAFMQQPPFRGRVPVFAGDDVTDEAGFASAQQMGGLGIKVGEGPTMATMRLPDPLALRQWLTDNARDDHTA